MGSVSQDFFPSTLFLSLSRSLNRTVTMLFLPRLPLLLAIIFLGLFCLPHTINCSDPDFPDCPDIENKPCTMGSDELENKYCIYKGRTSCELKCEEEKSEEEEENREEEENGDEEQSKEEGMNGDK